MKKPTAGPAAPDFNETLARPIEPRRHTDGRTIAFEQPAEGVTHYFSATGLFITTLPKPAPAAAR